MTQSAYIIIAIIIILIVGFLLLQSDDLATTPTTPTDGTNGVDGTDGTNGTGSGMDTDDEGEPITLDLDEQNSSGQSGRVTIEDDNGRAKISIRLSGSTPTGAQPAHIHTGSCASLGDVRYPLSAVTNGTSETTLTVPVSQLRSELPLAVNVHKSESETNVYVACGDIRA